MEFSEIARYIGAGISLIPALIILVPVLLIGIFYILPRKIQARIDNYLASLVK
jgi:hypothetical protein